MRIIIEGAGEVGSHLAKMLRAEANDVTVIDNDNGRLDNLRAGVDVVTIKGKTASISTLQEAGAAKADLYIGVCPNVPQEVNIVGAMLAKKLGTGKVLARINDEGLLSAENNVLYKDMGLDMMFCPEKMASDEIIENLKHNSAAETLDFARGKLQVAVFKLDEGTPVLDMKLGDFMASLSPEERGEFRVIAVSKNGQTIIPDINTKFNYGDTVFTISRREGVERLFSHFGKEGHAVRSAMIFGGDSIGAMVAEQLSRGGIKVKIIEKDKDKCIELAEKLSDNVMVVRGDGRNSDFLYEEGIRDYDAFIALTDSDETNVLACVVAKKFGVSRTIAEVENMEYLTLAEEMGVDTIINKKLITAGRVFKFTLSGKARFVRYMPGSGTEIIEYNVAPKSAITKAALKDIDFPSNAIIGGVIRGSESFIAVGDTVIEPYDRVAIFALPETLKEIDKLFR
ncbi:MAG: Trk system potassium transporter TrkA [Bacteroidales bacterium]|nr:Trk system potassium transporter TrkA [Bacteroidales bacterium]